MFRLCSKLSGMRIDADQLTHAILAAPDWAHAALGSPDPRQRAAAARELALAVLADVPPFPPEDRQLPLAL